MIYFPFDSEEIVEAETEEVTYDRAVDSDVLADWMATFFTNGIDSTISKCLQVSAVAGEMAVTTEPGKIMINGRYGKETEKRKLTIQASEDQDRYDYVVARLDKLNRLIDLYVLKGTKASIPTAPALTREGDIYELGLAKIFVAKGVTEIKQDRITDMRLDTNACGLISFTGAKVDTTAIFTQYQAALDEYLELVQSAIDGTTAGNLQSQITALKSVREVTLGTSWSGNSQTVAVEGITANDNPVFDVKLDGTNDTLHEEEWAKVIKAVTSDGNITFYLRDEADPTTTAIIVLVKGV